MEELRDDNRVPALAGVSSTDHITPVVVSVNPATNAIIVQMV